MNKTEKKSRVINGMPLEKREKYTGRHCICNIQPADHFKDAFRTGNGTLLLLENGNPFDNEIRIQHEELWCPRWHTPPKAPLLKDVLKDVQALVLQRKFEEADCLAHGTAKANGVQTKILPCPKHDAGIIHIKQNVEIINDYLHIQHLDTGEIVTVWKSEKGCYEQRMFSSRADYAAAIQFRALTGRLDLEISLENPIFSDDILKDECYPAIPPEMSILISEKTFRSDSFLILSC